MPLTRPKAHQLSGQSAKSSVRVVTTSNVTLSGGAPATVDGVSLTLEDRILVTAQTNATENGIYRVTAVGSGSNGTWVRGRDANQNEEVLAGMTTMVSEGTTYADTFWKLTTDGAVTLGTTELVFVQHSTVEAKSIANLSDVTLTSTSSNDVLTYNGSAWINNDSINLAGNLSAVVITANTISATESLDVTGNITGGNIATAGQLSVTGNVTGGNIIANTSVETPNFTVSDSLTIGSQIIYAQGANGFSVNEDFDSSNSSTQTAYHFTSGAGRETVAFTLARTSQFTDGFGIYGTSSDNKFVMFGEQNNTSWEWRRGIGIRPLDLDGGTLVANLSAAGNFATIGTITGTGNVAGGNLTTAGQVAATGNITGGNLVTAGDVTISGDLDLNDGDSVFVHGDTGYVNKRYVLYGTTTDATITEIFVGGTANSRVQVANNSTMFYTVDIVARRTDATGESAGWQLKGVADNFSGTTADVGTVYEVAVARDDTNWAVDVLADDTDDAVVVTVTGAAGKTIKWMAVVKTMEVTN